MKPDLIQLYQHMVRTRLYENAIAEIWHDGLISGEMHLGTGEEAIMAGIVTHLRYGDALALDHRGTAALLIRGADPVALMRELLGAPDGLCGGMGGHMHLHDKDLLCASSGIVGASGPAAAGFALSGKRLRPRSIAVGFFGEGAMNQGMLMESLNLAVVWQLPVLFVCKDDSWSIATESSSMTGGNVLKRAETIGLKTIHVNGLDVGEVWSTAGEAIEEMRTTMLPCFLQADCVHLEGHFLGYQLKRVARNPVKEMGPVAGPLARSFLKSGGGTLGDRISGLRAVTSDVLAAMKGSMDVDIKDPLPALRSQLEADGQRLDTIHEQVENEVSKNVHTALSGYES